MIKLVSDTIDRGDIESLIEWLNQDPIPRLTKGELTLQLESMWAKKIGTKYSVFLNSGSSAIFLTLLALKETNILKNLKIIVPALSWVTDVSSPMILGYETFMCDCNLNDLSCDLDKLENLFKSKNPSVFILVSPLGLVPKMKEIVELCEKYDVLLLEDVCESMGSKYQDTYLGNFGFASFFSTYFGHHLSTIEGGFINTNDDDFYHALLMLRSHGWDRDLPSKFQKKLRKEYNCDEFNSLYNFYLPGMNLRSTDLQAFLGIRAVGKLDRFAEQRRKNFFKYNNLIYKNILSLSEREGDFISNFAMPVLNYNRKKIVNNLIKEQIEVRPLIAGNMAHKPMWKGDRHDLENCDLIDKFGFYLPNHQDLTDDEIYKISKIINENG